jgi:predicted DNA-binding transcriptional regulator YafY
MSVPNEPRRNGPATLFLIQKALADRTVLRIAYRGSGAADALRREIEPLGLTYYGDRWHLIAWCRLRKDYRDFRTDRIAAISASPEQFKPHEEFSLIDFVGRWQDLPATLRGSIRADPVAAERIRKEAPFKIIQDVRNQDGVTFTIEVGNWNWYIGWLLSFGDRIVIIDPAELRTLVCQAASAAARHHESIRIDR